jgi:hypothetical protein
MWQFRSIRKCIACRNGIANHCPGGAASMIDEFSRSAAARALWPIFDFLETLGQLSRKLISFFRSTTINTRQPPQAKGDHAINKLFSAFRRVRRLTLLFIDHGNSSLL